MNQKNSQINMDMLMFIVNHNDKIDSKKILNLAADKGLHGATVMPGEGKAHKGLLRTLGIDVLKRDLVMLISPTNMAKEAFRYISEKCKFNGKNPGVGFRIPLNRTTGISKETIDAEKIDSDYKNEVVKEIEYQLIINISDINTGEAVMDVIEDQGGTGGTMLRGRGAASHEIQRVFNMEIEPEKDFLMTIVPTAKTEGIINSVAEQFEINTKNSGILFVVDLAEVVGFFNK